jgi:hypothetical protein
MLAADPLICLSFVRLEPDQGIVLATQFAADNTAGWDGLTESKVTQAKNLYYRFVIYAF